MIRNLVLIGAALVSSSSALAQSQAFAWQQQVMTRERWQGA